ncbi:MAG: cytidylyltransferase [Methylocystaceae bacterium]|nr:cytidylyltransferase [Methylocystaceae bacterium]
MIAAILIGRKGSSGFPGKNVYPILGRPLVAYPLMAAKACAAIDKIYVSTDSEELKEIARSFEAEIIDRPDYLATKEALGEDAYVHAFEVIKKECEEKSEKLELLVLLMANAPTISAEQLDEGIRILRENPETDSAVTVSCYNMWSPLRARKVDDTGHLQPFVPFETFGDPKTLNCDRDSQGDVLFADMGVSIIRPQNLEKMEDGLLPQKWMGQNIWPIRNEGGLDVDYDYQMPQAEFWLKKNGVNAAGE